MDEARKGDGQSVVRWVIASDCELLLIDNGVIVRVTGSRYRGVESTDTRYLYQAGFSWVAWTFIASRGSVSGVLCAVRWH